MTTKKQVQRAAQLNHSKIQTLSSVWLWCYLDVVNETASGEMKEGDTTGIACPIQHKLQDPKVRRDKGNGKLSTEMQRPSNMMMSVETNLYVVQRL